MYLNYLERHGVATTYPPLQRDMVWLLPTHLSREVLGWIRKSGHSTLTPYQMIKKKKPLNMHVFYLKVYKTIVAKRAELFMSAPAPSLQELFFKKF